jgi:alkylation response protein AidB-like acyl-CoA dehydrogenase
LTQANANLLLAHASQEQVDTWVRPMVAGRFFGTMCLSEPEAGSSLADITTRAVPQPDGTYRLFGNKMWISAGSTISARTSSTSCSRRFPAARRA